MISFKTKFHHCSKMQGRRRYLSALLQFIHVFHLFFAGTPQENQTHLSDSQKILLLQTLSHQLILWNEMYWTEILKWTILAVYELLLSDCNFSLVGEALVPLYEIPFFFLTIFISFQHKETALRGKKRNALFQTYYWDKSSFFQHARTRICANIRKCVPSIFGQQKKASICICLTVYFGLYLAYLSWSER